MKHLKKLTLLHSNDLHGDFMVEKVDNMHEQMGNCKREMEPTKKKVRLES